MKTKIKEKIKEVMRARELPDITGNYKDVINNIGKRHIHNALDDIESYSSYGVSAYLGVFNNNKALIETYNHTRTEYSKKLVKLIFDMLYNLDIKSNVFALYISGTHNTICVTVFPQDGKEENKYYFFQKSVLENGEINYDNWNESSSNYETKNIVMSDF